jgi:CRP-like cAMP-binding protein
MIGQTLGGLWQGAPQCSVCLVRDLGLFSELEQDTLAAFEREIARIAFPPGAALYLAGDPGDAVVTLRGGVAKLVLPAADGRDRIVRLLRTGDVGGLESLVGEPYRHTAVALGEVHACRIPLHTLERLAEQAPQVNRRVMHQWHRLVAQSDEWIAFIASGPARVRVARLLLYLAEAHANGRARCRLPTREDMAAMLGITLETASRVVADFRRTGLITTPGGHEASLDTAALETVARG